MSTLHLEMTRVNPEKFLLDLADLCERHEAKLYYTTSDDGIRVVIGDRIVLIGHEPTPDDIRKVALEISNADPAP